MKDNNMIRRGEFDISFDRVIGGIEFSFGLIVSVVQEAIEDANYIDGYLESVSFDEAEVRFDEDCIYKQSESSLNMSIDSLELGYSDVTASADDIKAWLGFDVLEHAEKLLEREEFEVIEAEVDEPCGAWL